MTTPLSATAAVTHDAALIPVIGELLYSNRFVLAAAVDVALGAGVQAIDIDLTQCPAIDSAGIGVLVSASKKARDLGCRIRLVGLDADLRQTFVQTQLATLFDWPDSPASSPDADPHGARHG